MLFKNITKTIALGTVAALTLLPAIAQNTPTSEKKGLAFNAPGTGNPIIPGYFADPTVRKFGDTYYIYATTDGNGGGLGPSQVWTSKDFVNWTIMPMNWPTTHYIWAPDVIEHNGSYYMMYCQPCQLYMGKAATPRGPWSNILGGAEDEVLVPDRFVEKCITLDGQTFTDDDGSVYIYFGTWGIYPGFGCGVCKLDENMKPTEEKRLIVNTEADQFFEAPFVIKKNGIYYLTYSAGSCHTDTYRVMYATSTTGPMGPYTSATNNPILATNEDQTIHGPGHHSILQEGDEYYIIYHRHDNPHSTRGMHRQIAADRLVFNADGTIDRIEAGHDGIGALQPLTAPENIAYCKPVTASSFYNDNYKPEYAVDDNNGTLWRPKTCEEEWLEIDLEEPKKITRIWTQFEYATSFYQYKIETSLDKEFWTVFSNKTNNQLAGSPMVDYGNTKARYVRLTFTGAEKGGTSAALWNIKVFSDSKMDPPQQLIGMNAQSLWGESWYNVNGMLGRAFQVTKGEVSNGNIGGKSCVVLAPKSQLISIFTLPMQFYNGGSWTLSYKIYGTPTESIKRIISWNDKESSTLVSNFTNSSTEVSWHSVAIVCDGKKVTTYLDNKTIGESKIKIGKIAKSMTITSTESPLRITDLRLFNWAKEAAEIEFDTSTAIPDIKASVGGKDGLLVDISADDYNIGSSINEIQNRCSQGSFKANGAILPIRLKDNRAAFYFEGTQQFVSNFALPEHMRDNAPYTISAWILNPEASERECILDITPRSEDGELGRITLCNGFNPEAGIIYHNGSFEDFGIRGYKGDNEWHHWVVTYDGHEEFVYRDGIMLNHKDIVLRREPNRNLSIGQQSNGDWAFIGYLNSLKVYDTFMSANEVANEAKKASENNVMFHLATSEINTQYKHWQNDGSWGGGNTNFKNERIYENAGKMALNGMVTISDLNSEKSGDINSIALTVAWPYKHIAKPMNLLKWDGFSIEMTMDGLIIKSGEDIHKISLSRPTNWYHFVLQTCSDNSNEWTIWVNGYEYATIKRGTKDNPTELTIGDDKNISTINEVTIYNNILTLSEIKDLYNNFLTNDLLPYQFELKAEAVSPEFVRVTVVDKLGKDLSKSSLLYDFVRGDISNQNTSDWVIRPDYLFKCSDKNRRNEEKFTVYIKDLYGNVEHNIDSVVVDLSPKNFKLYSDSFKENKDLKNSTENTIWDGLFGDIKDDVTAKMENGNLVLASKDRNYGAFDKNLGPLVYKNVDGDFLAQVHITDYTGLTNPRESVSYLEGGIMALHENLESRRGGIQVVQLGTFPYYNQGNILTVIQGPWREQHANMKGNELDLYLQMERSGDNFYVRTSSDGINWTNMPYSPVFRPDLSGKTMKVGLFQVTYTDSWGEVKFEDFKLWQRNK